MKKPKATPKAKKLKPTHTVHLWFGKYTGVWNWNVRCEANGEIISYSNQGHGNRADARAAIDNFLAAAASGRVEIVVEK